MSEVTESNLLDGTLADAIDTLINLVPFADEDADEAVESLKDIRYALGEYSFLVLGEWQQECGGPEDLAAIAQLDEIACTLHARITAAIGESDE